MQAADSGGWGGAAPAGLLFADHGGRCRAFTDGVDLEECKCKLPIAEDGEGLLPQASCLPTMAAAVVPRLPWCLTPGVTTYLVHQSANMLGDCCVRRRWRNGGGVIWLAIWEIIWGDKGVIVIQQAGGDGQT